MAVPKTAATDLQLQDNPLQALASLSLSTSSLELAEVDKVQDVFCKASEKLDQQRAFFSAHNSKLKEQLILSDSRLKAGVELHHARSSDLLAQLKNLSEEAQRLDAHKALIAKTVQEMIASTARAEETEVETARTQIQSRLDAARTNASQEILAAKQAANARIQQARTSTQAALQSMKSQAQLQIAGMPAQVDAAVASANHEANQIIQSTLRQAFIAKRDLLSGTVRNEIYGANAQFKCRNGTPFSIDGPDPIPAFAQNFQRQMNYAGDGSDWGVPVPFFNSGEIIARELALKIIEKVFSP